MRVVKFAGLFCLGLPTNGTGIGLHTLSCLGCRRRDLSCVPGVSCFIFHFTLMLAGCGVPVIICILRPFRCVKGMCMLKLGDIFRLCLSANGAGVSFNACCRLGRCFGHLTGIPCVSRFVLSFALMFTGCCVPVVGFIF